jgi:NADH:ubiquinone oxidoreductase subunit
MASLGNWLRKFGHHGNPLRTFKQLWVMKDVKGGVYIGTDRMGNKYYEDMGEISPKHRHVEYAAYDFDASQIPAEWHKWLYHIHQDPPTLDKEVQPKWVTEKWTENFSGDPRKAYRPYSTVKPKVEHWTPIASSRD